MPSRFAGREPAQPGAVDKNQEFWERQNLGEKSSDSSLCEQPLLSRSNLFNFNVRIQYLKVNVQLLG